MTSQSVTINSVDLSADCARAELVINSADVETTDFSSGGFVELQGGLKSGVLNLDFHADYASDLATFSVSFPTSGAITKATS